MGQFHDDFRAEVTAFLASSGMKPSALGRRAVGDPCFVSEIQNGRRPRRATCAHVREFMAAQQSPTP